MIHKRCDWCGKSVKKVGKLLRRKGMLLCKLCREKLKKGGYLKGRKRRRFHR